jgi:asparagine synthase (glutamine-hydrolysing)
MCGIAGIIAGRTLSARREYLASMMSRMRHRGPDGDGVWNEDGTWFGQLRLAIIDLSPNGTQPMVSHNGRHVITFNGEIYNFAELRRDLDREHSIAWRGSSDTEVLLELIARRGIDQALAAIDGMFAFAVWDKLDRSLTLARDRFGEKPLYYVEQGGGIAFASELTALEAHPDVSRETSPDTLAAFLTSGTVPGALSILRDVKKLPPASVLVHREPDQTGGGQSSIRAYWSIADVAERGLADPFRDETEAVGAVEAALKASCLSRMVSDVPLGAFLSGGVDSSVIVALMQAQSSRPVKTFTIGFEEEKYNEAPHAKAVAVHLGTDHTEQILSEQDALEMAPRLGQLYDEPFADSSAIPTYLVSRMARRHVTVCLSGDGGDELFGGYGRYAVHPAVWDKISRVPFRGLAGRTLRSLPTSLLNTLLAPLSGTAARFTRSDEKVGVKAQRLAERLDAPDFQAYYRRMMSYVPDASRYVIGGGQPAVPPSIPNLPTRLDWMCLNDSVTYLPDDILVKVDRAAMAVSLEGRMPLLDPKLAEVAWRVPAAMKMRDGVSKRPLREVLARHVPRALFERPKMGFGIPLREWLQGPLRHWAADLLSEDRLRRQGLLDVAATRALHEDFTTGRRPEPVKLWTVLMLQAWLEARGR